MTYERGSRFCVLVHKRGGTLLLDQKACRVAQVCGAGDLGHTLFILGCIVPR
jgi:hypothetical protein